MGWRVRSLLDEIEATIDFYAPDVCFDDAAKYIPSLLINRGQDSAIGSSVLEQIQLLVTSVNHVRYQDWEQLAREHVAGPTGSFSSGCSWDSNRIRGRESSRSRIGYHGIRPQVQGTLRPIIANLTAPRRHFVPQTIQVSTQLSTFGSGPVATRD